MCLIPLYLLCGCAALVAGQLPLRGFARAKSAGYGDQEASLGMTLKVLRRVNKPTSCSRLELQNVPRQADASKLHSSVFTRTESAYHGRPSWSNGRDVFSFVPGNPENDGEEDGTWIVGDTGGVDSGFAYIKPKHATVTPLEAHTGRAGVTVSPINKNPTAYDASWYWLHGKDWVEERAVTLACLDSDYAPQSSSSTSSFFEVQFFASPDTDALTTGFLQLSMFDAEKATLTYVDASGQARVLSLVDVKTLCELGRPVSARGGKGEGEGKVMLASLVTDEVSRPGTFRLTMRAYSNAAAKRDEEEEEPEVIIEVGPDGVLGGASLSAVGAEEEQSLQLDDAQRLAAVRAGDYVWLWWHPTASGRATAPLASVSVTASGDQVAQTAAPCPVVTEQEASELLLKCTFRSLDGTHATFQRFDTDRVAQMQQSTLSRDTDLWVMSFEREGSPGGSAGKVTKVRHSTSAVQASNAKAQQVCVAGMHVSRSIVLGDLRQTVAFVKRYLGYKERQHERLSGSQALSSCFFYHAAVSLPQALIYAAEILCVLVGAKPAVMVQYTSPTELQHKFPLVAELSRGVVTAATLLPDGAWDVGYSVDKYRADETLVIFRSQLSALHDALLPRGQAQALHPIPYPGIDQQAAFGEEAAAAGMYSPRAVDAEAVKAVHKHRTSQRKPSQQSDTEWAWSRQIFFAWWNGYVLGYPEHFIDAYCESFHNGLDVEERRLWSSVARRHVEAHFRHANLTRPRIFLGMLPSVDDEHLDLVLRAATQA